MKVLIVEDSQKKLTGIIDTVSRYTDDYRVTKFVSTALIMCGDENYDLIITDLGLPRFVDHPIVVDAKEGLKMLYDLSYQDQYIPAIIYSTTQISEEEKAYTKDIKYPVLGQVTTDTELDEKIQEYLKKNKEGNVILKLENKIGEN